MDVGINPIVKLSLNWWWSISCQGTSATISKYRFKCINYINRKFLLTFLYKDLLYPCCILTWELYNLPWALLSRKSLCCGHFFRNLEPCGQIWFVKVFLRRNKYIFCKNTNISTHKAFINKWTQERNKIKLNNYSVVCCLLNNSILLSSWNTFKPQG